MIALDLLRDLRYAIRALTRSPRMTAILLLTIAVGTGSNATVFTFVDGLLFRAPPGVQRPSSLVTLFTSQFSGYPYGPSSHADFLALKDAVPAFASLAAVDDNATLVLRLNDGIVSVRVSAVSGEFFQTVGLSPAIGGALDGGAGSGAAQPAVLAFAFWQDAFNGDEHAIGMTLTLDGRNYTIAGVAPPGFRGLQLGRRCDIWVPLAHSHAPDAREARRLAIVGRLRPGISLSTAQQQIDAVASRLADEHPESNRGMLNRPDATRPILALPYSRLDPGVKARTTVISTVLFSATGLVLLCACGTAGGLLLSRGSSRKQEMGVRLALGATRPRLVQQLVIESLVASTGGGLLGLLFSRWTSQALPSFFAPEQAALLDSSIDVPVFLFTLAISVVAGVLFGVAPAVLATGPDVVLALRSDPSGTSSSPGGTRLRSTLVVGQIALSIVLLVATLQMVRAFGSALSTESSEAAHQIAVAEVTLPGKYADEARSTRYMQAILVGMSTIAGTEAAAWVSALPLVSNNWREYAIDQGTGVVEYSELPASVVSGDYFGVMRIPLLAGRRFDGRDTPRTELVVIVNDVLATRYFGATELAIDRHLQDANGQDFRIVGVVASDWYRTLQPPPQPTVYHLFLQQYVSGMNLVVRTARAPAAVLQDLRDRLTLTDSAAEVRRATTLDAHLSEALGMERLTTVLLGACGLMALTLATVGVYGIMADAVTRRTRELGLRLALGARPGMILRLIFGGGLALALIGVLVGAALAVAGDAAMRAYLQGISRVDARVIAGIAALMIAMVVLAAIVPALRALRVNPMIALRHE